MKPHPTQPEQDDSQPATYDVVEAARQAGVHEQTLRHYERLGLVTPARKGPSPRSPRLYTEDDITRVAHIRRLVEDLGVNLAGVETILHMRDRMEQLRQGMDDELRRLRREHDAETQRLQGIIEDLRSGS
jgi:MerR family transcriptional regulator, heat shock protein HspR